MLLFICYVFYTLLFTMLLLFNKLNGYLMLLRSLHNLFQLQSIYQSKITKLQICIVIFCNENSVRSTCALL